MKRAQHVAERAVPLREGRAVAGGSATGHEVVKSPSGHAAGGSSSRSGSPPIITPWE